MIILCADDFGLSDGVSRGIAELCTAGRLSATSAMVTFARWQEDAKLIRDIRTTAAVGLHLNLTLGRPLIAEAGAEHLDRDGGLRPAAGLIRRAMLRQLDRRALRHECMAQIEVFRDASGALPDFIDGHQHVHVLPVIRDALVEAIGAFTWPQQPLVRMPSDKGAWFGTRQGETAKRTAVAALSRGARQQLHNAGLPTNETFAGFSGFQLGSDYGQELRAALESGGGCHLVMCHPGHVDAELAASGDPLVERRAEELSGIMAFDGLTERIWHPVRETDGSIDWVKAMAA